MTVIASNEFMACASYEIEKVKLFKSSYVCNNSQVHLLSCQSQLGNDLGQRMRGFFCTFAMGDKRDQKTAVHPALSWMTSSWLVASVASTWSTSVSQDETRLKLGAGAGAEVEYWELDFLIVKSSSESCGASGQRM
ncbi:hypothetical protein POTOM_053007 [Populus tomentosa]|uniref:Uncharacterized protein n=1 Tax=Populus tomentosa TaxID=118781 RepID=A0A8X8C7S1_POPTO|nr:hypothetical protein POTOM_053007 [Populus tomentosa]